MSAEPEFDVSTASGRFLYLQFKSNRYYRRALGDECADLAVEVWTHCERKLDQVRTSLKSWLSVALRRHFLNWLRRRRPLLPGDREVYDLCEAQRRADGVIDSYGRGEAFVASVLERLPERQRQAMTLRFESNGECPANWDDRLDNAFRVAKRKLLAMPEVLELAHEYGYC